MAQGEPDQAGNPCPRQASVRSPWSPFIWNSSISQAHPRVWPMSRVLRQAQDRLVPEPCMPLSRRPSWAPDLGGGGVTFHAPCSRKGSSWVRQQCHKFLISSWASQLPIQGPLPTLGQEADWKAGSPKPPSALQTHYPKIKDKYKVSSRWTPALVTLPSQLYLGACLWTWGNQAPHPTPTLWEPRDTLQEGKGHMQGNITARFWACGPLCLPMHSLAPSLPPSPPGHCSNIGQFGPEQRGKKTDKFLNNTFLSTTQTQQGHNEWQCHHFIKVKVPESL